jgi:hypothetical protein
MKKIANLAVLALAAFAFNAHAETADNKAQVSQQLDVQHPGDVYFGAA